MKSLAAAVRKPGGGRGAGGRVQRKAAQRAQRHDSHEQQAEQRGEQFVRGGLKLGRGLSPAPAAGFVLPSSVGEPLPGSLREALEMAFNAHFGAVRIHRDAPAQAAAAAFGASAFTSGVDVYFAPQAWDPWSPSGQRLIAHELAHVLQQAGRRSTGLLLEARAVHGGGAVQCAPGKPAPAPISEDEQKSLFDEAVKLHRGGDAPTGDLELEKAIERARVLLGGRLVNNRSRPAFSSKFNDAVEAEFRPMKSVRARSFVLDCLKLLGHFKVAGLLLTDDADFKLRTLGLLDAFGDFLKQDADFGRQWLAAWLTHDAFKKLWPAALLRAWRGFYLRPRFILGLDPALQRRLQANTAEIDDNAGKSPPTLRGEHYWLVWLLIGELDQERIQEQGLLRDQLGQGRLSLYEALQQELPGWREAEAKKAENEALPAYERTLASGKIPFIDEAIAYWNKAFADYGVWLKKLKAFTDATLIDPAALDLPDGSLVAAAAAGLRSPFIQAAQALFTLRTDADGKAVFPGPDEYRQGLDKLLTALTGSPVKLSKKGESLSWAGHVEAMAYAEATAEKPDPARLAQFAIFPLIVNDIGAQAVSYKVQADQAAPHFDDIRRAHRLRLARSMLALARWLGWHEIVDVVSGVLTDAESDVYTGKPRLLLVDDWHVDERVPISRMIDDFPGNRDKPILHDAPFTVAHLVEWFRYDYHHRLRETLDELLRAELFLTRETKLDFTPLDHLRQTRKEVQGAMAAGAEAEYAINEPVMLPLKVPQRFSVPDFDVVIPPGAQVDWDDLILSHPKTQMQLARHAHTLVFPRNPAQGVFAWALPPLDGLYAVLSSIPSIATIVARRTGETDADWLSRLAPVAVGPDGKVSDEEKAQVRLSDEDWKRLNEALLRWLKKLGEHEEDKLPGLWRRLIILRRRWLAMVLIPRIEHFAEYPYVSHGPLGESDRAMKLRLETPDRVIDAMRAFEASARPMRERAASQTPQTPEAQAAVEQQEREEMQKAVDVQLVLLTLTMAPSLLKLRPSIIDGRMKRHLYELYQLAIDHLEDEQKLKALKASTGVEDEAVPIVFSAERRAEIVKGMKAFMTAVEEELKASQTQRGFRSEDGKSIRPNADRITHAIIASKKPGAAEEAAREWHLNMQLAPDGTLDESTGDTYRLVEVYCKFEFHPQAGSAPVRSLRKGAGGPFSPARLVIDKDGQRTEYTAPELPDIDLFKFRINDAEFIVNARDLDTLTELDDVFLWRSFQIGMKEISAGLETFADWMTTVASVFFPEVAIAEFVVGMAQMLANGEFEDLVRQLKDDPIEFAKHALEQLRGKLFNPDRIWEYVLLGGQHSPLATLRSFLPTRKRKVSPGSNTKFGRVVGALRGLGGRFVYGLERVREYTQPPLRRAQGRIAMHPTLVWVLHRAAHIVQAAFDLIPMDKLQEARRGDGPAVLVEFAQALLGEQGAVDKELRARVIELFEGIQHFELPGELVQLTPATELIIGFILDRFGKRGKILRMLLSVMPVPESWAGEGERKGFTNALTFLATRIQKAWWAGSALDPNKYWKEDLMPLIGTKFNEVRDDLVQGLYDTTNGVLTTMGLEPLVPPAESALPRTEVVPEPLLHESEASAPTGALCRARPQLSSGGGTRLPARTRGPYERQLGADLSHVRVHADAGAATRPLGADALTSGSHVYLRPGVSMGSPVGQRLLAHELTHVVQQTGPRGLGSPGTRAPTLGRSGTGLRLDPGRESVADEVAARMGSGRGVSASLRARIGSADGIQPSLGEDVAMRVIAALSTVESSADFTKHLEGGRDPEGFAEAKALAQQVFSVLRSGVGVEYAAFLQDSPGGQSVSKLARDYLRELTDKFPELQLKRIAALAQTPRKKTAEGDPDTALSPKSFVQLLANYLFAERHVALQIDTDKDVKRILKIEIFNLNMGKIGGHAKLWDIVMTTSFGGNTAVADEARAQREMRERLNSIGPLPKIWESRKFRFAQWLIDDYVALLQARALGSVADVPKVKDYANTESTAATGLAVSTHGNLTGRGIGAYERESHHTTQYLLVEFFGNLPEASQKAFPGNPADFAGAGVGFRPDGVVNSIEGAAGSALKISPLNPNSERGAQMPAILLSARTHQRGELHVLRESRWEDKSGDKERKGTATQGLAIENTFNQAIANADLRPREDTPERRARLREAIKTNPAQARTAYYKAALATYKWMNDRMIPALKEGLLREEYAYYRGIAARNHMQADGEKLQPEYDLRPEQLSAVHEKAEKNDVKVMSAHNWKA